MRCLLAFEVCSNIVIFRDASQAISETKTLNTALELLESLSKGNEYLRKLLKPLIKSLYQLLNGENPEDTTLIEIVLAAIGNVLNSITPTADTQSPSVNV